VTDFAVFLWLFLSINQISLLQFSDTHKDEATCIKALADLRWPEGFICDSLPASESIPDSCPAKDSPKLVAAIIDVETHKREIPSATRFV
jgi:hypothetical protein